MRVLAEIAGNANGLRPGSLRRSDLEAYDRLRVELAGAAAVLVAGNEPDGREVALGLAAAAAAGGTRTALLECELARPALAESLGLAAAPGLHEYLRGTAEVERILKPVVLAGPASAAAREPLVCVVAGRPAPDPAALLASARFRHAAAGLRAAHELLVIAAPSPAAGDEALLAAAGAADAAIATVARGALTPSLPLMLSGVVVRG